MASKEDSLDFIPNRNHQVLVGGTESCLSRSLNDFPVSVPGPIPFIIYINDLLDSVTSAIEIFADDTKDFSYTDTVSL